MTRRKKLLALPALLSAAIIWFVVVWIRPGPPYATLRYLRSGKIIFHGQVVSAGSFCMTNLSNRPIGINASFIDVKDGAGWHVYTNVIPEWDLRSLGPFQSGQGTVIPPPSPARWRVHVWVSSEAHGISAFPAWLRHYADRRTWQMNSRFLGWRVWNWPPFGRSAKGTVYDKPLELISEEVD